jgi:hypothetical protein
LLPLPLLPLPPLPPLHPRSFDACVPGILLRMRHNAVTRAAGTEKSGRRPPKQAKNDDDCAAPTLLSCAFVLPIEIKKLPGFTFACDV